MKTKQSLVPGEGHRTYGTISLIFLQQTFFFLALGHLQMNEQLKFSEVFKYNHRYIWETNLLSGESVIISSWRK